MIEATGGSIAVLGGSFTDPGVVSVDSTSVIYLQGTFSVGSSSSFAGTGAIELEGTLDNTGETLTLNDPGPSFAVAGGTIDGGTVETTGGAALLAATVGGTLDGVTIDGTLDMTAIGDTITVTDGLTLGGTIDLGPTGAAGTSTLDFQGAQTLSGTGSIVFGNFYEGDQINTASSGGDSGTLTIGPNITIQGTDGNIGYDHGGTQTPLVLEGTIDANTSGGSIQIYGTNWTNSGTIEATGGGAIDLETAPSNFTPGLLTGGTWRVGANSALNFPAGNIATDAATIILGGPGANFPALSSLAYIAPGATLELSDGASFATTTSLLNQGTINVADPGILNINGNFTLAAGGQLDVGVGGYSAGSGFSQLNVTGKLTLGGALDVTLLGGFTPALGNSFAIINYGSVTGSFATESGLVISSDLAFSPVKGATQFDLDVIAAYVVINTADSGAGSLRNAIEAADASTGGFAIEFDINSGRQTISPISPLPAITAMVELDATSQPGYAGTPLIELDGTDAGSTSGLVLAAGSAGSVIQGLVIGNFSQDGILIESTDNVVENSYIGTNALSTAAAANQTGILIAAGSSGNTIGGTAPGAGNVISGNSDSGVEITGTTAKDNLVVGNSIGTDVTGTIALGNGGDGVYIDQSLGDTIGGTATGAGNLISANAIGVEIFDSSAILLQGNSIGLDQTGMVALGNTGAGVMVDGGSSANTIGGPVAGARNLISGNAEGVLVTGSGTTGTLIAGNLIGTDVKGAVAVANVMAGIELAGGSATTIGGTTTLARNVISGNDDGLDVESGATNTLIQGNYIGIDQTGAKPLANTGDGVSIDGATGTTIGGTAQGAGNVISANTYAGLSIDDAAAVVLGNRIGTDYTATTAVGNGSFGILVTSGSGVTIGGTSAGDQNIISGNVGTMASPAVGIGLYGGTTGTLVQGNLIGTDDTGSNPLGNGTGIQIDGGSSNNNTIGGTGAGAGNTIAYSTGTVPGTGMGVDVDASAGTGNAVRLNSIFSNTGLGIDLGGDGVTLNDSAGHSGPDDYQNFPVITGVSSGGGMTTVSGTLTSSTTPNTSFYLDFYTISSLNISGYGEGRYILGSDTVTTGGTGYVYFSMSFTTPAGGVQYVTATATPASGNTSEFSQEFGSDVAPTARISFTTLTVKEGEPVTFDGSGSTSPEGDPLSYSWKFGDLATATGPDPTHTYLAPGTEQVSLTVNDGFGGTSIAYATINVVDVPPAFTPNSFTPPLTYTAGASGGGFGSAVASDYGNVAVGAPYANLSGAVYLYDGVPTALESVSTYDYGQLIHVFADPNPTSGDEFGASLAVVGNELVVGRRAPTTATAWRTSSTPMSKARLSATCWRLCVFPTPTFTVTRSSVPRWARPTPTS